MTVRYVHVEVRELLGRVGDKHAEADCRLVLPTGEQTSLVARLHSDRAPFWRVVALETFGNPLVDQAVALIGEDELCTRIAHAAALWNVWDSLRAKDPEFG